MTEEFIAMKDRIIAAAIEIISDGGLASLTTRSVSAITNITESYIYKFYQNTDELLADVVDYYFRFDNSVFRTVSARSYSYTEKIKQFVERYAVYYDNYYALSTIMLQYEELLHNPATRDHVEKGVKNRRSHMAALFQGAIDSGEIVKKFTAEQLTDALDGITMEYCLDRRITYHKGTFQDELCPYVYAWLDLIRA